MKETKYIVIRCNRVSEDPEECVSFGHKTLQDAESWIENNVPSWDRDNYVIWQENP
jgi:hypothetical protein